MIKALKLNVSISIILLCTVLLSGTILMSSYSSASSASTALASVKVAASCTLTTSGGGNYSAIVPNGTSVEIAGSTMSVSCNDAGGFALYAVGYSDDTVGNNNMIGSSTNIPTNTSGTNSYWAMKINPTSGTTPTIENSFNNYHIVPDSHTKIASYSSSTGSGSLSVDATYKANISSTQLAGNYLGKVKYTLVHPQNEIPAQPIACDPGKICYNPNTNIVEGQMGKQTPTSSQITNGITLWAPNFKRDGYGFAGWSDKYDYETNTDAHFYGPQETISAPSDFSANGLSLYAVWIESEGILQDWDCGRLMVGNITALTDERDGNTYTVAKLEDYKCWMVENLRLDDSASLSVYNTNNPSLPLTNIYDSSTTSNHLSSTSSIAYNATTAPEGWCATNSSACDDQSRLRTDNIALFIDNTSTNYNASNNVYSYGNYYNWYSATAGHGKYGSGYGSGYNAPGDICPFGWNLPTGSASGDIYELNTALNDGAIDSVASNRMRSFPNNFVFSGDVSTNASSSYIYNRNSQAYYWTASAVSSTGAFFMQLSEASVVPSTGQSVFKYSGRAIRCVTLPLG